MRLLESYLCGKRPDPALCEDGWVVTADFAAVVDGSTSKRQTAYADLNAAPPAGESGGRQAMRTTVSALRALPATATAHETVGRLTAALRRLWPKGAREQAALRPTCSAVIYSRERREVWMIGDCQCRFDGRTRTNPKLVDAILTQVRCDIVSYALSHGKTPADIRRHDPGRAFIYGALRDQTNFQNVGDTANPYRYGVLDGADVPAEAVKVIAIGPATERLILASDGYPEVCDTLAESEARLAHLLHDDPLCIGPLAGTKGLMAGNRSFDDRTYLSLQL